MKKFILSIIAVLFCTLSFAQQSHLQFKGHEITGSVREFAKALISDGFTFSEERDGSIVLKDGNFAGTTPWFTMILRTPVSGTAWKVVTSLEPGSWLSAKTKYKTFKEAFTKKYGEGKSYEWFLSPYYEGDGYECSALRNDKCSWSTFFHAPNGTIVVEINGSSSGKAYVSIVYEDGCGVELLHSEKDSQISSDI